MQAFLFKVVCFTLIVTGANMWLSSRIPALNQNVGFIAKYMHYKTAYLDSTNLLALGSSRTYRHLNPFLFDSVTASCDIHTQMYNLGYSAMLMPEMSATLQYIRRDTEAMKRIDYLILEFDDTVIIPDDLKYTDQGTYYLNWKNTREILRWINGAPDRDQLGAERSVILSSMMIHYLSYGTGVQKLNTLLGGSRNRKISPHTRGYDGMSTTMPDFRYGSIQERYEELLAEPEYISWNFARMDSLTKGLIPLPEPNLNVRSYYLQLIDDMAKQGIRVMLLLPLRKYLPPSGYSLAKSLPPEHIIVAAEIPGIEQLNDLRYWMDKGHLHQSGAEIYTRLVAKTFCEKINR